VIYFLQSILQISTAVPCRAGEEVFVNYGYSDKRENEAGQYFGWWYDLKEEQERKEAKDDKKKNKKNKKKKNANQPK
jgi:hypothetical protein